MQTENNYAETDLGNIAPNPMGDYNSAAEYEYLDLVTMQGGSYLCLAELGQTITGTAPEPGKTTELWQCLAMPGDRTPEYTDAHDKVVRLAKEVAQDAAKVAEDKQSVTQMETNARQLKEQAEESARQAENSKDSAAGSAREAKKAEESARQAENNVRTQVNGFDAHVAEKTTEATQAVATAKDNAMQAVGRQETASVQGVKDQTGVYITEQKELAKQELDDKVNQFGLDVNAIKTEVTEEGTKQIKAVQDATVTELAKITEKGTEQTELVTAEGNKQVKAVQTAAQEIIADREQIQKNKADIASLTQNKADAIVNTATGEHIAAGDSSGHLLDNLKIYGKSVQNGTPTPDNPVPIVSTGDYGEIYTAITGKNLIDFGKYYEHLKGNNEFAGDAQTFHKVRIPLPKIFIGKKITLSALMCQVDTISRSRLAAKIGEETIDGNVSDKKSEWFLTKVSFTMMNESDVIFINYGTNGNIGVKNMQLEISETATEYEPYQPLQSLTLHTPNGLLGIPVKSGGNYTDQNGQQWICDEIDLKRGKYVKRVGKIIFDGDEHWWTSSKQTYQIFGINVKDNKGLPGLCNRFTIRIVQGLEFGCETQTNGIIYLTTGHETIEELKAWLNTNPVTVLYVLNTSTETDIPQETLIAYKKLHSNYPSTVVQNTEGAGMELSYVADTKNYTDNKIKEAVSAQTQSLANLLSLMPLSTQAAMIETDTNNILDNMEVEK